MRSLMRWLASNWGLVLLRSISPAIVIAAVVAACTMPHEIFGWKRPENLTTICHVWDARTNRTMMFNDSMAKRHIKHHDEDYWGECQ